MSRRDDGGASAALGSLSLNARKSASDSSSSVGDGTSTLMQTSAATSTDVQHDGGFRALASIDKLPIDPLLPSIHAHTRAEPLTIVQAATGSGKRFERAQRQASASEHAADRRTRA